MTDTAGPTIATPTIASIEAGMHLPRRTHIATNVSLFLYNAAVWNAHRIHYDEQYAVEGEGHAGVVIDGPLQGDWISQIVLNWLGADDRLIRFGYSNRRAAHLGDTLVSGGTVAAVDVATSTVELDLFISTEADEIITPGTGTVLLSS